MILANSIVSAIGQLFHPLFEVVATLLAWIYGLIPNYAVAIGLLTLLVMAVLTPLTVKSTKSMLAMQRLQPEMKKLQQKYKGPENRQLLNEELMKLYKEAGVNPASSCVPMFLQMPFFIVLYDTIRGLTNTVTSAAKSVCPNPVKLHGVYSSPRYIPHTSTMFHNLCASGGSMPALGINLALKPTSYHATALDALPYYALVLIACALQFVQMWQMNRRNPGAMQANPQMRNMQYFMPIIFAVIYVNVQSAVVIYMIISTLARIVTQDVIFRTGIVEMPGQREISRGAGSKGKPDSGGGSTSGRGKVGDRLREALGAGAAANVVENGSQAATGEDEEVEEAEPPPPKPSPSGKNPSASARPPSKRSDAGGQTKANGAKGSTSNAANGQSDADDGAAKSHPRSKSKRTRKAR